MEIRETLIQVCAAALSVVGFYLLLHVLVESLLVPKQIITAVVIREETDPAELDILLCEARRAPFGRGRSVALVIPAELLEGCMGEEYRELAEKYQATVCVLNRCLAPDGETDA